MRDYYTKRAAALIPGLYDYGSLYGMDFTLSRGDLFETYSGIPTHNMVFTGIDIEGDTVRKWLAKNSWGDAKGKRGYFFMLDEWFHQMSRSRCSRKNICHRKSSRCST